ncbi:MAG TPA: hypothetical protein GX528_00455 [Firmicutes bacterium]|nr:hypothetical protein [Bacillota bacterium]
MPRLRCPGRFFDPAKAPNQIGVSQWGGQNDDNYRVFCNIKSCGGANRIAWRKQAARCQAAAVTD